MEQIRQGVFETNSSSTHSISIAESQELNLMDNSLIPDLAGIVTLTGDEFGWAWERFNDARTKANYLAVYTQEWSGENSESFWNTLCEVIKEQTGATDVLLGSNNDEYYPHGYIDHQSAESGDYDYLFADKDKMRDFIFNPNSVLFTGNDNEYAPNKFYDEPGTVYTHQLKIDLPNIQSDENLIWDFLNEPSEEDLAEAISRAMQRVRFNENTNEWQINSNYWSGEHYYEYHSYSFGSKEAFPYIDFDKQIITLICDRKVSDMAKDALGEDAEWGAIREKEEEFKNLAINQMYLNYTLKEL